MLSTAEAPAPPLVTPGEPPVRLVWASDDDPLAAGRVRVTERADVVMLSSDRLIEFWAADQHEPWHRRLPVVRLIFTFRRGGLRVLVRTPGRDPMPVLTIDEWWDWCEAQRLQRRRPRPDRYFDLSTRPGEVEETIEVYGQRSLAAQEALRRRAFDIAVERVAAVAAGLGLPGPAPRCGLASEQVLAGITYPALLPALDAGLAVPLTLPPAITPALRRPTARQVAEALFGRRVTRRLVAAVGACLTGATAPDGKLSLLPLTLAAAARGSLEPDQLVTIVTTSTTGDLDRVDRDDLRVMRRVLATLSAQRVLRLAREAMAVPNGPMLLHDALQMFDQLDPPPPPRRLPGDLRGFHDRLSRLYTDAVTDCEPLAFPPELTALHETLVDDDTVDWLRFVVPIDTAELAWWGTLMGNCIASYGDDAVRGETWLLGVEDCGGLSYNLEIRPWAEVVQFFGPRNSFPRRQHEERVLGALRRAGLIRA